MPLAVFTTLHKESAAHRLAESAVAARLAACVHIETIASVFRWEGSVQREPEFRLLFKTTQSAYPALAAHILDAHPYDEPALWAVPMAEGSESFFAWIAAETAPASQDPKLKDRGPKDPATE
ncbi:MAG: divalent-cation tolerance protein CutA [Pseudomonadota bacterium]